MKTRTLTEALRASGDFSFTHAVLGLVVITTEQSRAAYYALSDYAVSASLSAGQLQLRPAPPQP